MWLGALDVRRDVYQREVHADVELPGPYKVSV
jgi:hypothetical protein